MPFQGHHPFRNRERKKKTCIIYESVLKRCLMGCVYAVPMCPVSDYRRVSRQNQFDLPLLPCILSLLPSLNPAAGMWRPRGGFSVGSVLIPEGHLHWFRIIGSLRLEESPSPAINLMLPGPPLNHVPKPSVLCQGLKIHPMIHGNHSSFLKRRPGGTWQGCFVNLHWALLWKALRLHSLWLGIPWGSSGSDGLTPAAPPERPPGKREGPRALITQHRLQQVQALSGHITIISREQSFSRPPCPANTLGEAAGWCLVI